MAKLIIDIHAHLLPTEWIETVKRNSEVYGCCIDRDKDGHVWLRLGENTPFELTAPLFDMDNRLKVIAAVDLQASFIAPNDDHRLQPGRAQGSGSMQTL